MDTIIVYKIDAQMSQQHILKCQKRPENNNSTITYYHMSNIKYTSTTVSGGCCFCQPYSNKTEENYISG